MARKTISIIGTVGVPGAYGGFETLAENLVRFHEAENIDRNLVVYCSSKDKAKDKSERPENFLTAQLRYVPLDANGVQSIVYDMISMMRSVWRRDDTIIVLGVSGALFLPIIRLVSRVKIITNIDGIEWRREKWSGLARKILKWSERSAVRFSHVLVTDNKAITEYVAQSYGVTSVTIPYGGDHALHAKVDTSALTNLPKNYALALCRIEPENNIETILRAWTHINSPLVFVGNWDKSAYGRELKARFSAYENIHILDPVYEPSALKAIRSQANLYVHGHSAGGTNPSLVEMMHFDVPVLAHHCAFNKETTENKALYFEDSQSLVKTAESLALNTMKTMGAEMGRIARARYTWETVAKAYFELTETR